MNEYTFYLCSFLLNSYEMNDEAFLPNLFIVTKFIYVDFL